MWDKIVQTKINLERKRQQKWLVVSIPGGPGVQYSSLSNISHTNVTVYWDAIKTPLHFKFPPHLSNNSQCTVNLNVNSSKQKLQKHLHVEELLKKDIHNYNNYYCCIFSNNYLLFISNLTLCTGNGIAED